MLEDDDDDDGILGGALDSIFDDEDGHADECKLCGQMCWLGNDYGICDDCVADSERMLCRYCSEVEVFISDEICGACREDIEELGRMQVQRFGVKLS